MNPYPSRLTRSGSLWWRGGIVSSPVNDEAVVFSTAIEGFMKSVGNRLTPELRKELAELGVNVDVPQVAYPLEIWERALRRASEALFPAEADADRWRLMGRAFMHGYVETLVGRASFAMARLLGPRRTLERMARNPKVTLVERDLQTQTARYHASWEP